ncbi:MAG: UPF0149 family protein [Opitutaceae bacterium]
MTKFEAWIASGWSEQGIANVIVSRTRSDGCVDAGFFLVDAWCLGIKDAFLFENAPPSMLQEVLDEQIPATTRERIHPACAKRLIDGAIAYADKLGFLPCKDFKKARKALSGLDASSCDQTFTFGKNGKPCFVAGPNDTQERIDKILRVLTARLGPDGFTYIVPESGEEDEFEDLPGLDDDDDDKSLFGDDETEPIDEILVIRDELRSFFEDKPTAWPTFERFLGSMTAMLIAPEMVPPFRLLETLPGWGPSFFTDREDMKTFIDEFTRYWNSLSDLIALEEDAGPSADSPIELYEDEYDNPESLHLAHVEWAKGFCATLTLFPKAWGDAPQRKDLAPAWSTLSAWAANAVPSPTTRREHQKLDKAILTLYRALRKT